MAKHYNTTMQSDTLRHHPFCRSKYFVKSGKCQNVKSVCFSHDTQGVIQNNVTLEVMLRVKSWPLYCKLIKQIVLNKRSSSK